MRPRYAQSTATHFLVTFGYAWLAIALFLATLTLVAVIRSGLDQLPWSPRAQDTLLFGTMLLLAVGSFRLARCDGAHIVPLCTHDTQSRPLSAWSGCTPERVRLVQRIALYRARSHRNCQPRSSGVLGKLLQNSH